MVMFDRLGLFEL